MTTKFRTRSYVTKIEEVEIERETDKCVWVGGVRVNKASKYFQYHDTYEKAFKDIEIRYRQYVTNAVDSLLDARAKYKDVLKLRPKD